MLVIIFQKRAHWEDGNTVAFKYVYHSQMDVTVYECWLLHRATYPQIPKKCVNLSGLRKQISKSTHSQVAENKTCLMMLVSNLVEPQWIYINCDTPYLADVLCVIDPSKIDSREDSKYTLSDHTYISTLVNKAYCSSGQILMDNKCYLFVWYTFRRYNEMLLTEVCKHHGTISANFTSINKFETIFNVITSRFPPIIKDYNRKDFQQFEYTRHIDWYVYKKGLISIDSAKGLTVCEDKKISIKGKGSILFECEDGKYISQLYLCDGKIDCRLDGSDETYHLCQSSNKKQVDQIKRFGFKASCGQLFYVAMDGSCQKYHIFLADKSGKNWYGESNYPMWKGDLFQDCEGECEYEQALGSPLTVDTFLPCVKGYQIPCVEGYQKCFDITEICIYKLNKYSNLVPCQNGEHLQNCRMFECNAKFKCPNCILWSFVCDGKWDCPEGADENGETFCQNDMRCAGMFRCHGTYLCILWHNVCDGYNECYLGDDEMLCELKDALCPSNCQCILFAISCYAGEKPENLHTYISIKFSGVVIKDLFKFMKDCQNVIYLQLSNSELKNPCHIYYPKRLQILDFGRNIFETVKKLCFISLSNLQILMLDQNEITYLHTSSFVDIQKLNLLNISDNPLKYFIGEIFKYPHSMKVLSLRDNELSTIDPNAFLNLKVDYIETDDYRICCLVDANYICSARKPWFKSCTNLLPDSKTVICFITISFLIITANVLSIFMHKIKFNSAFSVTVISLNIKDILCAIYFKIIWISHFYLSDTFAVKEEIWRSGLICFVAFGIILWFTLLTQAHLVFLSLLRLMVAIKPLETNFKDKVLITKWLVIIFTVCFMISTVITVTVKLTSNSLPFHFCFPFIDPTNSIKIIKIITWTAVNTQFVTSIGILVINMVLIYQMLQSPKDIGHSKTNLNTSMVVQLVLLTICNFLCWFPMNGIYISAMFLSTYPTEMIIWGSLIALPLNSLFNPLLFFIIGIEAKFLQKGISDKRDIHGLWK